MDSCGYSPINFPLQPLFSGFFFFNVFLSTALLFVQFPIYSIVSLFFGLFPGLYLNFHLYSSIAPTILDSFSVLTFERAYLRQSISFIVAFSLFVFWFFFFPFPIPLLFRACTSKHCNWTYDFKALHESCLFLWFLSDLH